MNTAKIGTSILATAAVLFALTAPFALGETAPSQTMYARASTPVRSMRTLGAPMLGTLKQGEAVKVTGKEEDYYRVIYDQHVGWVYYNKLTDQKPEDVSVALGGGLPSGGIQLTEQEAGGALRGLSPMAENYAREAQVPAWAVKAVDAMQARSISVQQLDQFQKEGGLGEYRGGTQR